MPVTYRYSRLTFKRDVIELLKDHDSFRVETRDGAFQMTKKEFYSVFKSVTSSESYTQNGLYNYPTVPEKALRFLISDKKQSATKKQKEKAKQDKLPPFLVNICTSRVYKRWLHRKAMAHFKRDSKRGIKNISCSSYRDAIHKAVLNGGQFDAYTGEALDWTLISKYDNADSKAGKREYKKKFWNLPTVDHFDENYKSPTFKICSWRLNACKNDLNLDEFIDVCQKVIKFHRNKAFGVC